MNEKNRREKTRIGSVRKKNQEEAEAPHEGRVPTMHYSGRKIVSSDMSRSVAFIFWYPIFFNILGKFFKVKCPHHEVEEKGESERNNI